MCFAQYASKFNVNLLALKLPVKFTSNFFVQRCYAQLFCTYSLCLYVFKKKEIGRNAAHKMLVKLTTDRTFLDFKSKMLSLVVTFSSLNQTVMGIW